MQFLHKLLQESDFVVVAAPHTPETEGFFNSRLARADEKAQPISSILGGVIVPLDDLVSALNTELSAGAALDVYEIEPLPAEHPLWGFPNVILTPHIAIFTSRS